MIPMENKRIYTLVMHYRTQSGAAHNDTTERLSYTSLEYALYNGFRHVLDKYIEVNKIKPEKFKDLIGRSYDNCIANKTCSLLIKKHKDGSIVTLEMNIERGELVDDEFLDFQLEETLKISQE